MADIDPLLHEALIRLEEADRLEVVQGIVRTAARGLARSHGATLVLREGDRCFYPDEDAISPLWKGQRFPLSSCISGWAMLHRDVAVVPDVTLDARIPQEAYRPTFVRSLVMVPIRRRDPLGAIGAYWAMPHRAARDVIGRLEALAEGAADAVERIRGLPTPI